MASTVEGAHQHAKSGRVYAYRAEYEERNGDIAWRATVSQDGELRLRPDGVIRAQTPAAGAIAEPAVVDAVLQAIDHIDDASAL